MVLKNEDIVRWLEGYQALENGESVGAGGNSGPAPYDGVTSGFLNKIMLDDALKALKNELPAAWACARARWILRLPRRIVLRYLGMTRDVYYGNCDAGVTFIRKQLNGEMEQYHSLLKKVFPAGSTKA